MPNIQKPKMLNLVFLRHSLTTKIKQMKAKLAVHYLLEIECWKSPLSKYYTEVWHGIAGS